MIAARVRFLIATLWVGSLWSIGYIVAPTLFATLADRVLAGMIAGSLFRIEAWLSLTCGVVMLILFKLSPNSGEKNRKSLWWIVTGMLLCTLVGYFGLQPFMAALKEAAGSAGMQGEARTQFGILHGVSSVFYLVQSLLGAVLVWKLSDKEL